MMRLRLVTPIEVVADLEVGRIVAQAQNGAFGILPRHVDFVSALVPGIMVYETRDEKEHFAGLNTGTLVKVNDEVLVATRNAILGDSLETLQDQVSREFLELDEQEREARSALARLEAGMVRRFLDLERTY